MSYLYFFGTYYGGPGDGGQPHGTLAGGCKAQEEHLTAAGLSKSGELPRSTVEEICFVTGREFNY